MSRAWFKNGSDNEFEVFTPRPGKPVVFGGLPPQFCTNISETPRSTMKFYLAGRWTPLKMAQTPPMVQFTITPRRHVLFSWRLMLGSQNTSHSMDVWSLKDKQVTLKKTTQLKDLDNNFDNPHFNLTISCNEFPKFKTELNIWTPGLHNPRNPEFWDSELTVDASEDYTQVTKVEVDGGMVLDYAGFTQPECLSLTSTGLVVPKVGIRIIFLNFVYVN